MLRTNHHDTPEPTTRATRHALDQRRSSQPDTSHPLTEGSTAGPQDAAVSKVEIPQYRRRAILAVWAAAALPMAALAWLVAPAVADRLSGEGNVPMVKALTVCLTVGLIWQFVLVMASWATNSAASAGRLSARRSGFVRRGARAAAAPAAGSGWS